MISLAVMLNLVVMYRPIHFNNHRRRMAVEIGDESINDLLAAKMKPVKSVGS